MIYTDSYLMGEPKFSKVLEEKLLQISEKIRKLKMGNNIAITITGLVTLIIFSIKYEKKTSHIWPQPNLRPMVTCSGQIGME
jgi:hypothetical protein